MPDLTSVVEDIAADLSTRVERGQVASYIPMLAQVPIGQFGIAVTTAEGETITAGDAAVPFSIQSISKVFTLTLALGKIGDELWARVGKEPSGNAFNSIVQLEAERGIPRNPFINAGAIVVADAMLAGAQPREALGAILRFLRFVADDETITIDEAVARSEKETGFRNTALANYMRAFGVIQHNVEHALGVYFHQCAIAMTCRQLAMAGRYLAFSGRLSPSGPRVVAAERARRIAALMLTCGHYDGSGDFAFRVGLPGKSGVGGGILAIAPGKASVSVWSPGLDRHGNSVLGSLALERLAKAMRWSVFAG
ncbi:glutaminase [Azorhizobium oxalatiphilum]|uniref:Glutaminase n=1 Tax=Azorhizobium oxalatiphilum TaxID=980631 RepID=A0A917FCY6_9HYPH|nr:glutaminase [Azorhizobium oxalatiphilum]GGF66210.1 glutaminase [Azorhizobium oxalatiphilum]